MNVRQAPNRSGLILAQYWRLRLDRIILVPFREKSATLKGWPGLEITDENIGDYFNGQRQNCGVLLGEVNGGLVDIDLDTTEAAAIASTFLTETLMFGRKSAPNSHRLYRCPGIGTKRFQIACEGQGTTLVEIRSSGSYTLLPGSQHPSGEYYKLEVDQDPCEINSTELEAAVRKIAAGAMLARKWPNVPGIRHDITRHLAGALMHARWKGDEVIEFLGVVLNVAKDDEREDRTRAVQDTIAHYGKGGQTSGLPALADTGWLSGQELAKLREWLRLDNYGIVFPTKAMVTNEDTTPEPLRREMAPAPPFPIEALPPLIGNAAKAVQRIVKCPAALACQSALGGAAVATQSIADIVNDGRAKPSSLYMGTIAESGERKSGVDSIVLAAHREIEKQDKVAYDEALTIHEMDVAAWERQRKQELSKKGDLQTKRAALEDLGPRPQAPVKPLMLITDPTIEGLFRLLAEGRPSVGIFSDEGGIFIGGHGMSQDSILRTAGGLSSLYDGGAIDRVRAGDAASKLYGRRVSMHLMMQGIVGAEMFQSKVLREQGLLSRFLTSWPESTVGSRSYQAEDPFKDPDIGAYHARVREILRHPFTLTEGTQNQLQIRCIGMTHAAKAIWVRFHDYVDQQTGKWAFATIRSFANKAPEHALRIAAVFTLFEDPNASQIGAESVEAAINLTQYYLVEALRLYGADGVDDVTRRAEELVHWMRRKGIQEIYPVLIYTRGPASIRSKREAWPVLELLESHHWIRRLSEGKEIDGKMRKDVWVRNF